MRRLLLFLLPIALLISNCADKNGVEQAYQHLAQSDALLRFDKAKAKEYAQKALDISLSSKDKNLEALSLQKMAATMRYNTSLDSLLAYDKQAVEAARAAKNNRTITDALGAYTNDLLLTNNLVDAQTFLDEQKKYCDSLKNDSCMAVYQQLLGFQYFKGIKMAEAKQCFEQSLKLAKDSKADFLAANAKLRIFQANVYSGIIDTASQLIFEAKNYFTRNKYAEGEAATHQVLGEAYRYQGNMPKAMELLEAAKPIFTAHQNYMGAMAAQNMIGQIAMAVEDFPMVKQSAEKLDSYNRILNYPAGRGLTKTFWGSYYSGVSEFDKADKSFAEADSIAEKHNLVAVKAANAMMKTLHFERQKKTQQADSMAVLSYRQIQEGNVVSKELIQNTFKNRRGELVKDTERKLMEDSATSESEIKAYLNSSRNRNDSGPSSAFVPMLSAFDSSVSLANARQLLDLETQYKTRIIADSLALQKQQAEVAQAKLKARNVVIASGVVLLLLVAAGLWVQIKNRRRAERDKSRIELLQNEIHHRVKNNLAVINRLVDVAGKDSLQETSMDTLKTRIKSIELLHRHLYSEEARAGNISLQAYLDDLCTAIAATFATAKDIRIAVNANAEVDSTIAEKLGLIVNELVTNSFKYAFQNKEAGTISIMATQNEKELHLKVEDNGIGMPEEKTKGSYGMRLIRGLSAELNGKFSFQNSGGTQFQLSMPVGG